MIYTLEKEGLRKAINKSEISTRKKERMKGNLF